MLQVGGAVGGLQELEAASVAAPAAAGSDDICDDAAVVYASEKGKGISLEKFLNLFLHFTSCQSLFQRLFEFCSKDLLLIQKSKWIHHITQWVSGLNSECHGQNANV